MSRKEEELAALNRLQRKARKIQADIDSRSRLKRISHRKFRTCFIAALSEFETTFGLELWGHDLPIDKLTTEQVVNRKRWEQIRKNILDKGNAQSRALGMEIDLHEVSFRGYSISFGGESNE